MSPRTATALLTAIVCMLTASCAHNGRGDDQDFAFTSLKTGEKAGASFDIDLSDSSCVYSISLISRFEKDVESGNATFLISLTSPSGLSGSERITLSSGYRAVRDYIKANPEDSRIKAASAQGYYDLSWTYRTNIFPQEYGMWKMDISVAEPETGVLGLGISVNKTPLAGR